MESLSLSFNYGRQICGVKKFRLASMVFQNLQCIAPYSSDFYNLHWEAIHDSDGLPLVWIVILLLQFSISSVALYI